MAKEKVLDDKTKKKLEKARDAILKELKTSVSELKSLEKSLGKLDSVGKSVDKDIVAGIKTLKGADLKGAK